MFFNGDAFDSSFPCQQEVRKNVSCYDGVWCQDLRRELWVVFKLSTCSHVLWSNSAELKRTRDVMWRPWWFYKCLQGTGTEEAKRGKVSQQWWSEIYCISSQTWPESIHPPQDCFLCCNFQGLMLNEDHSLVKVFWLKL